MARPTTPSMTWHVPQSRRSLLLPRFAPLTTNARTAFDVFAAVRHAAQLGHIAKNRQKRDSKNSWNRRIILVPATVWQILNVKRRQPETEVMWICRNFHGKTCEITLGELMFWRIFDIWNHCAQTWPSTLQPIHDREHIGGFHISLVVALKGKVIWAEKAFFGLAFPLVTEVKASEHK